MVGNVQCPNCGGHRVSSDDVLDVATDTEGKPMKKQVEIERDPDMLDDYDFSQSVRGKYVQRFAQGSNVVVLSPDLAEMFPDSEAVNNALRLLADIASRSVGKAAVG